MAAAEALCGAATWVAAVQALQTATATRTLSGCTLQEQTATTTEGILTQAILAPVCILTPTPFRCAVSMWVYDN